MLQIKEVIFGVPKRRMGLLIAGLIFLLNGCSQNPGKADFTFINGAEPESVDPAIITGQPDGRICSALFEGLVTRDAEGHLIPGVAERWDVSPDGLVYTFHLHDNTQWSNGDPVTAQDFSRSWERVLNPATASKYSEILYFIAGAEAYNQGKTTDFSTVGVRAMNDRTLEVRLAEPTPFFLEVCAFVTYFPVHLPSIQKYGEEWIKPGNLVSNGAYVLKEWRIDDRIRLEANPHYWRKNPRSFHTIDALSIVNATTAFNIFYSGKADLLIDKSIIPTMFLDKIRQQPYFQSNPFLATYFYRFNVTRPELKDPRVRQALALAIDKQRLVDRITRGGEQIAGAFCPPGLPHYTPPSGLGYDPGKARALLSAAGYPAGKGFPVLSLLYNSTELNAQIATEIQDMWKKELGITITLRNQEWKVYLNSLDSLNYDIARSSWVGDYNDPNTFLDCFVTGRGNNRTGWSNAQYDELLKTANHSLDPVKRAAVLRQAETILVEQETPIVPLYYFVGMSLYDSTKLGGFHPNVVDEHPLRELYWIAPR